MVRKPLFAVITEAEDADDITIPSTFVTRESYTALMSLLSKNATLGITILPPTSPPIPIIDTLFLVLLMLTMVCVYTVIILRSEIRSYKSIAPRSIIKSLPTGLWTQQNTIQEIPHHPIRNIYGFHFHPHRPIALECVICLENFREGDIVLSLPCDHDFHEACMYSPILPPKN